MRKIIVQKYGGSSVADADKILNIAQRIRQTYEQGNNVIVVVSAMGNATDELIKLAYKVNPHPSKRELDVLLSTGEQVSIALLAMALHRYNIEAVSLTGGQVGIETDGAFTKAKIVNIKTESIKKYISQKKIVIVAGFQGVDRDMNITTLGRGGSDTTAVAVAAAVGADLCQIYTDVDGVYTADPRIVKNARKLDIITYDDMLELASLGAKVLHSRAVEIAKKFNTKLEVRSSFKNFAGTTIVKEYKNMENLLVTGVTSKDDESRVTIVGVPDVPGTAAKIFKELAKNNINVNIIVQSATQKGFNDISFTINENDIDDAKNVLNNIVTSIKAKDYYFDKEIGIISIVGVGMQSHPGVAQQMFETLGKNNINIQMISTSEIKISCVIDRKKLNKAMRELHKAFNLDKIGEKKGSKK